MLLPQALVLLLVSALGSTVSAASSWTFADGSLSVISKGSGSKDGGLKEKYVTNSEKEHIARKRAIPFCSALFPSLGV
jgi:hypothetical protein